MKTEELENQHTQQYYYINCNYHKNKFGNNTDTLMNAIDENTLHDMMSSMM
jgi:hypothetical protein